MPFKIQKRGHCHRPDPQSHACQSFAGDHVRHLINLSYLNFYVPGDWRSSIVIPIFKSGLPPDAPSSYRPVTLTPCLCKALESVISNHLYQFTESKIIHNPSQAGFRKGRSKTDHLVQLEADIKREFTAKRSTVAVFGHNKAYNLVWIEGMLYVNVFSSFLFSPSFLCQMFFVFFCSDSRNTMMLFFDVLRRTLLDCSAKPLVYKKISWPYIYWNLFLLRQLVWQLSYKLPSRHFSSIQVPMNHKYF